MRNGFYVIVLCLIFTVPSQAQDIQSNVASGETITLQEAIDIALENKK